MNATYLVDGTTAPVVGGRSKRKNKKERGSDKSLEGNHGREKGVTRNYQETRALRAFDQTTESAVKDRRLGAFPLVS